MVYFRTIKLWRPSEIVHHAHNIFIILLIFNYLIVRVTCEPGENYAKHTLNALNQYIAIGRLRDEPASLGCVDEKTNYLFE